ncbi:MAG: 23S rRNA (guanosine(2251)-2'-O)-methyltransferase RlmB [Bacilli bacterium]
MNEIIYGKNTVIEALKAERVLKVFLSKEFNAFEVLNLTKKNDVKIEYVDKEFFKKYKNVNHQNIVAEIIPYKYYNLDDELKNLNDNEVWVMLDEINDPHNFGAIIRTCEAFGIKHLIVGKNRCVKLNSTVAKVSTGAIEYIKVVEVVNLNQTIKKMQEKGFWIYAAENKEESVDFQSVKYEGKILLVIGSEGKGISPLVLKNCDFLIKIPLVGKTTSLNASVSFGILACEISKIIRR